VNIWTKHSNCQSCTARDQRWDPLLCKMRSSKIPWCTRSGAAQDPVLYEMRSLAVQDLALHEEIPCSTRLTVLMFWSNVHVNNQSKEVKS
jgi:hypothetical protein